MYVMEHVRMEISKEGSVRLRDSKADTIRATDDYGYYERHKFPRGQQKKPTSCLQGSDGWVIPAGTFREKAYGTAHL
jgi:hypothetical protein